MLKTGLIGILQSVLKKGFFLSAVFLMSVETTLAASNFIFSGGFTSADPIDRVGYMDAGGTWNGSAEVTDSTGDSFNFTLQNSGPDTAFDFALRVNVPSGFRLPNDILINPAAVSLIGTGCGNLTNLAVSQAAVGAAVIIAIPANSDIPVNCEYAFSLGLTTNNSVILGANNVDLQVDFSTLDNGPAAPPALSSLSPVAVNSGLSLDKTILTPGSNNGDSITYNLAITAGSGGVFDVVITDTVATGLSFASISEPGFPIPDVGAAGPAANQYSFTYLDAGQTVNLIVVANINIDPIALSCPDLTNTGGALHRLGSATDFITSAFDLSNSIVLGYDLVNSFCELCGIGRVQLLVQNLGDLSANNLLASIDLNTPGLSVVQGSSAYAIDGAAPGLPGSAPDPNPLGAGQFEWNLGAFDSPLVGLAPSANPQSIEIFFDVQRIGTQQTLASISRLISANVSYDFVCGDPGSNTTGPVELRLEQPLPQVDKLGRNTDAGQLVGNYADTVFGHIEDDIIWRVELQNFTGQADLQNLVLRDNITAGNFDIDFICATDASAQIAADRQVALPADCIDISAGTVVNDLDILNGRDIDPPLNNMGSPANLLIDVPQGDNHYIYYIGRILGACTNHSNTSTITGWGCELDNPGGGTLTSPGSNNGVFPPVNLQDSADLQAFPIPGLVVTHNLTGIDGVQPLGSKGLLTITISNQTDTTVRQISLRDILPAQYVMDIDASIGDTVVNGAANVNYNLQVTPSFGVDYGGMVDTITWSNRDPNLLNNTAPEFTLSSSTSADNPAYDHMLRQGDSLTISFRIILIDSSHFDLVENLDIVPELDTPSGSETDPVQSFQVRNRLQVNFQDICIPSASQVNLDDSNFAASPEDLDVDVSDALYILTNNPASLLPLSALVTNNGGHDADDYLLYVTFGEAMVVQTGPGELPPGCSATSNPPPVPVWDLPEAIPASASVFECSRGIINPGNTETFTFSVMKNTSVNPFADDLTFRADVIGRITHSDGPPINAQPTLLIEPPPASIAGGAQLNFLSNNYSQDGIRSRVLGFNLSKILSGSCSEDNPPPLLNENVVIGEDCDYHIEAGGWFGFDTPGFTLIAVRDVTVTDQFPDGQGFIATDDGAVESDGGILNINRSPANLPPLTEGNVAWTFNEGGSPVLVKDQFFKVNLSSRILNDPLDPFYPFDPLVIPNLHGAVSRNIALAQFTAEFDTQTFVVNESSGVPGYPVEADRAIDLNVTEPNIVLVKTVCNETLSMVVNAANFGENCDPFVAFENNGDTNDTYIYRIEIYNELENNGVAGGPVPRSRAHEIIVTDSLDLDLRDQMFVFPFETDGLDNDGDGDIDAADLNGEGTISDNILQNGVRPVLTFSYTHSTPLVTMLPGDLLNNGTTFYYKVDIADSAAPLQTFNNTVDASYDSLPGDFGDGLNAPLVANGVLFGSTLYGGGARRYDAIEQSASIQVLPVLPQPKQIVAVANSGLGGSPQQVAIGEEIQFRLTTSIPVSSLKNFIIEDVLPPGMRCVADNVLDGQVLYPQIDLDSPPYSAAGFSPGGQFNPVCTQAPPNSGLPDRIIWNFGDQDLTLGVANSRFDFELDFVARIENSRSSNQGDILRNGGEASGGSKAETRYEDVAGNVIIVPFIGVSVELTEPQITVTKSFAPLTLADGLDILRVSVSISNANNATTGSAYNVQILDDLSTTKYNYIGNVSAPNAAHIPDTIDFSLGLNQPIFSWELPTSDGYAVEPAEVISFSYDIQVDHNISPQRLVSPHEQLLNTIDARWTSLPYISSAISGNYDATSTPGKIIATGIIDNDGEFLGMRNGQLTGLLPSSVNPPNDYNASANDLVTVVPLLFDKTDITPPGSLAEIGAHKQFSLIINLPEGLTQGINIKDNLAAIAGGLSYVIENDPGASPLYDIEYSFLGISHINGTDITGFSASTAPEAYEALFNGGRFPADEMSGVVEWDIGDIITLAENDVGLNNITPQIIIRYYARINNDVNTDAGDQLQNAATLSYINGQDASIEVLTTNTPAITLTESQLSIIKAFVGNITSPGIAPDAGDILEYTLTIDNVGDAQAYDLNIVDSLDPGTQLVDNASYTPQATITLAAVPTAVAGFNPRPLIDSSGALTWGRGNGDESLDLPYLASNNQLLIRYRVVVQNSVQPNQILSNNVNLDWTSLEGASPLERNGQTCPLITAPNDYCTGLAASIDVQVADNASLSKLKTSDSFNAADADIRIGDTVEYSLNLSLQEGSINNLLLTDVLPIGMRYSQILSINGITAAPFSNVAPFQHASYSQAMVSISGDETTGTTLVFNLGSVLNEGVLDLNDPANNTFQIIYQAQLVDQVLPLPQVATTPLSNNIVMSYIDGVGVASDPLLPRLNSSQSVAAQQPIIFASSISKTATAPSGSRVSSGATLDFSLSACNTGNAPAYDVVLQDIFPTQINEASIRAPGDVATAGTLPLVTYERIISPGVTVSTLTEGVANDYIYQPPAASGGTLQMSLVNENNPLLPGQCVLARFDVDLIALGANVFFDNQFLVSQYFSLDIDNANQAERQLYAQAGPVLYNMNTITPNNPPEKSSLNPLPAGAVNAEATIGELITYQIVVPGDDDDPLSSPNPNPMQVDLFEVHISDSLSPNLTFISAVLDTSSLGINGSQPYGVLAGETLDSSASIGNQMDIMISNIPVEAGTTRQAFISVTARVNNLEPTYSGSVNRSFGNTVSYTFAAAPGGGEISPSVGTASTDPLNNISIVEPLISLNRKTLVNVTKGGLNPVDAGDILRYTLELEAAGGVLNDRYSDAFDISIVDSLSPGLAYVGNLSISADPSGTYTASNSFVTPTISGTGSVASPQTLSWNNSNGSNIDMREGTLITLSYDVVVSDLALANQALDNSSLVQWSSMNGIDVNERDGSSNTPLSRRYIAGPISANTLLTTDTNSFTKTRLSDTFNSLNDDVRIGDLIDYELRLNLQEGNSAGIRLLDTLPQGLQFEGIVSINGVDDNGDNDFDAVPPFSYVSGPYSQSIALIVSANTDPRSGATTVAFDLGDVLNAGTTLVPVPPASANDDFVLVYRARVLNLTPSLLAGQTILQPLQNNIQFNYFSSTGVSGNYSAIQQSQAGSESINLYQPSLSISSKTLVTAGGDAVLDANEVVTYSVSILNSGQADAYDVEIRDNIPQYLQRGNVPSGTGTVNLNVVSVSLLSGNAFSSVPVNYNSSTGVALWNFDSAAANQSIPAGDTLQLVYQVAAEPGIGAGITGMVNQVRVLRYHSFDNNAPPTPANIPSSLAAVTPVRQVYGPSAVVSSVPLSTLAPEPLSKLSPSNLNVTIGEAFNYRLIVPQVEHTTSLYDVRMLDDLRLISSFQGVDLIFTGVTKISTEGSWVPVNTGDSLNVVIEDPVNGIDIPVTAGVDQARLDITVMLRNTPNNIAGDSFINSAFYTFNQIDGNSTGQGNGGIGNSQAMTIVEPELQLEKRGPLNPVQYNQPIHYSLILSNVGDSPAYDVTVADLLPTTPDNGAPFTGGSCNRVPDNFSAQVYLNDETTLVGSALVLNTDYRVDFSPAPACELRVTTLTAAIPPTNKLIISYDTYLDVDSVNGALLTNSAGIIQYFSQDTADNIATGEIREYAKPLDISNGIQAHESQYTVSVLAPVLWLQNTVENLTSGQTPAVDSLIIAEAGDQLRYTLYIQNSNADIDVPLLSLINDVDALSPVPGYFVAGSLKDIVISSPATDQSNANGGLHNTGYLDISDLSLSAAGGAQDSLSISFTLQIVPVAVSGSMIRNQAFIRLPGFSDFPSDDPNVNGADNPLVIGDEDSTNVLLSSVPTFQVLKTSQDLTDDPAILRAGDILRYTITAKNIGIENSFNTLLLDNIPANTTYIPNSTRLNSNPVPDRAGGVPPLQDGLLINGLEDSTPGRMRADVSGAAQNIASISFDVYVATNLVDGTVISNQGFVVGEGEGSGPYAQQPSDNPQTELQNDPTQDVVGNLPILDAQKTVLLVVDAGTPEVVDIGDVLEYEIIISNGGVAPATQVSLTDILPVDTLYLPNSLVFIDPQSGAQTPLPDTSVLSLVPLVVRINGSDLPLHDQAENNGQINPSSSAILRFRVTVVAASQREISNQGTISSAELPDEPTDMDGNDENGDQPTVISAGLNSSLFISKQVFIVGGGLARPESLLEYVIQVENSGRVNATDILLTDSIPSGSQYLENSAKLNGSSAFNGGAVSLLANQLRVDYQAAKGALDDGKKFTFSFRVRIDDALAEGTDITNVVNLSWAQMNSPLSDFASIDVGGAPGVGVFKGHIWHETQREIPPVFTEGVDLNLEGWLAQVYLNGNFYAQAVTDENGLYELVGLPPGSPAGGDYALRFMPPDGSDSSASMGPGLVDLMHGTDAGRPGEMRIENISLKPGSNITQQHMPVTPHGFIYDSIFRTPVEGVQLSLRQTNGDLVPASCLPVNANQRSQTTLANGFYRFDIQAASCGISNFVIQVDELPQNYVAAPSLIIPPGRAGSSEINISSCNDSADDMVLNNNDCDIQFSAQPPGYDVPVRLDSKRQGEGSQGTTYYLKMRLNANGRSAFNNHIPVDPELINAIAVSKMSPLVNVTRGQLVPYTITLLNTIDAPLYDLDIEDIFPAGFKYIARSARLKSAANGWGKSEPIHDPASLTLIWENFGILPAQGTLQIKMLLVVGSGVGEGEYINRAQVRNNRTNGLASGVASATVRVVPDPTFDCSDVIGKVFDDKNLNAYQDEGEPGIADVRVLTARGLAITTDAHGRFHLTCALVPNPDRGSNFMIKLDERSLPSGYRIISENPRVLRATRGKMLKFNFATAIHRVVRLDIADAVFEPKTLVMRLQWRSRLDLLMTELAKDPSILRLSYLADNEPQSLVEDRLQIIKEQLEKRWQDINCCYQLLIETEVFWRKGSPPKGAVFDE